MLLVLWTIKIKAFPKLVLVIEKTDKNTGKWRNLRDTGFQIQVHIHKKKKKNHGTFTEYLY